MIATQSQVIRYQPKPHFQSHSLTVTTCTCSYLNLAVRQLIKPLYLSNGSPETEHDGLSALRQESSATHACVWSQPHSWLFVFPAALITVLQPTWRPTSLEYIDSREEEAMLLCTQSSLRIGPTEGGGGGICAVLLWFKNKHAGGIMRRKSMATRLLVKRFDQSISTLNG